jgi:SAM-dependent methyltransferase
MVADPLPAKDFDLVHARLVLCHLPEREQVLQRIMAALKPGGWIVIEDVDSDSDWPDPKSSYGETLLKTNAAMYQILTQRGVDFALREKIWRIDCVSPDWMTQIRKAESWSGRKGSRCNRFAGEFRPTSRCDDRRQTHQPKGICRRHGVLEDPNFMMPSLLLWAAWGRVRGLRF